jgi:general secretion pathway protein G
MIHQSHTHSRLARRTIRRGFTLLEIIVVVTIIALLATLVAPKLLKNVGKTKVKVATNEVASIAQQVNLYLLDNGLSRPPDDLELPALAQGSDAYLREKDLIDPWGNSYQLIVPGVENSDFDVISYGANGEPGGEGEDKDIVN